MAEQSLASCAANSHVFLGEVVVKWFELALQVHSSQPFSRSWSDSFIVIRLRRLCITPSLTPECEKSMDDLIICSILLTTSALFREQTEADPQSYINANSLIHNSHSRSHTYRSLGS